MSTKGTNSNSGRNYAGQNLHRGPALPPNNHDGGNWPSTHSGKKLRFWKGKCSSQRSKKKKIIASRKITDISSQISVII